MDQTLIKPADEISKNLPRELVEKLHLDILVLIFQVIIDEDKDPNRYSKRAPAIARLALVNKRWRDIVYGTPSLWPTVQVILSEPAELEQSRLDHFTARAKNSPVNLRLQVHSHTDSTYRDNHPTNCGCPGNRLTVSLQGIQNLHSLTAILQSSGAALLLKPEYLPSLANVRHFRYHFSCPMEIGNYKLELAPLLSRMPKLTELNFNQIDTMVLPTPKLPLLFCLRTLDIKLSTPSAINLLLSFLLHCPNLVNLHIGCWISEIRINILSHPTTILHRLKKLDIQNMDAMRQIFAAGLVKTPVLEELCHGLWDNYKFEGWREFFASSTTLKKLTMGVYAISQYDRGLRVLPNLEDLTLRLYAEPTSKLLSLLCLPDTTSSEPTHHLEICPNLRRIRLQTGASRISFHAFESFIHNRCIPISEEHVTIAGYHAVESVILQLFNPQAREKVVAQLRECTYGKQAVVRQLSPTEYHVHWPFHSSQGATVVS